MLKGRSKSLIKLRNEKLILRYYYWTEIQRRRFDDVLMILSLEEIFLTPKQIMFIIRTNGDKLKKLRTQKPDIKKLQLWSWSNN
jgi:hypothetical protein